MMNPIAFLFFCFLMYTFFSFSTACQPIETSPQDASTVQQRTLRSADGVYKVSYTPETGDIPLNQTFSINVQVAYVAPKEGRSIPASLQLEVDAEMPAHQHGMNQQPVVTKVGPGNFKVEGMLFHMPGEWVISILLKGIQEPSQLAFKVDL